MKPPQLDSPSGDPQSRVEPPLEAVSGPSFPVTIKALATALVIALGVFGWSALPGSSGAGATALATGDWAFLVAVTAVIGSGYWVILTGRTRCDGECIEQSGLWRKSVKLADIRQVKLISLRGLGWLLVPRLVVRTAYGLTSFHAGDAAVLARFRLLAYGA